MITKIGLNNNFQKFILKTKDKKFLDKMNRNLPIYESLSATAMYLVANEANKKIPKERKSSLNWQTLLGGGASLFLSKSVDSWSTKHKNKVCDELKKLNIKDSEKIIAGTRIAIPIIITSFISRYLVSTLSVPVSILIAKNSRGKNDK